MFQKFVSIFRKPDDSALTSEDNPPPENEVATVQIAVTDANQSQAADSKAAKKGKPSHDELQQQRLRLQQAKSAKLSALQAQMVKELSPTELRELALDLHVPLEDLTGGTDQAILRNFLAYLDRRGRIPDLLETLVERWPEVDWQAAEILQAIEALNQFGSRPLPKPALTASAQEVDWRKRLNQHFNLNELATIAFELGIDFDALHGSGKVTKINSLLALLTEAGRLDELAAYVARERPNINFNEEKVTAVSPLIEQTQQYRQKLETLSLSELQVICQQLSVEYEDLRGESKPGKVRELLVYLSRKKRLAELEPLLMEIEAAGETAVYHTHAIRTLIFQLFPDDVALTDFCRQHLPQAVYEFGSGMSYRQKTQALLEYCALKKQFTPLLAALEATFPEAYAANGPYIAKGS